jgi:predicted MFS family arabinose efflux permease
VISFFVAPIAGRLSSRLPVRLFLGVGLGLTGLALLLMSRVTTSSGWTVLLPGFLIAGIGIGMVNPPLAATAVSVVEPQRAGMASGINNTFRQVGIATGIAGLGAIFQNRIASELHGSGSAQAVASGAVQRGGDIARAAFVSGLHEILLVGAFVAFAGAVLALVLVRERDFVASRPAPAPAPAP